MVAVEARLEVLVVGIHLIQNWFRIGLSACSVYYEIEGVYQLVEGLVQIRTESYKSLVTRVVCLYRHQFKVWRHPVLHSYCFENRNRCRRYHSLVHVQHYNWF